METIHFSIDINADPSRVYRVMLDDATYREWTKEFNPGSFYIGNWNKGSEIRFVGVGENGKEEGMFSRIKENRPNQFVSIEHLGIISNGVVDTTSEQVKKWAPSFENYTFESPGPGRTKLTIEMQTVEEYKAMFEEMWPRALKALKGLCEAKG